MIDDDPVADDAPAPAPLTSSGDAHLPPARRLYRLSDGLCTTGPCVGLRLHQLAVDESRRNRLAVSATRGRVRHAACPTALPPQSTLSSADHFRPIALSATSSCRACTARPSLTLSASLAARPRCLPARSRGPRRRPRRSLTWSRPGHAAAAGAGAPGAAREGSAVHRTRAAGLEDQEYEESVQALSAALLRPSNSKAQKLKMYPAPGAELHHAEPQGRGGGGRARSALADPRTSSRGATRRASVTSSPPCASAGRAKAGRAWSKASRPR